MLTPLGSDAQLNDYFEYGTWRVKYDADLNCQIYSRILTGGPELCGCIACKKFMRIRDSFYPPEFKTILLTLGINYKKETEVVTYGDDKNPPLEGWYNFAGIVENGEQDFQYIKGNFRLELTTGGLLVPHEFGSLPIIKIEWKYPAPDLRYC